MCWITISYTVLNWLWRTWPVRWLFVAELIVRKRLCLGWHEIRCHLSILTFSCRSRLRLNEMKSISTRPPRESIGRCACPMRGRDWRCVTERRLTAPLPKHTQETRHTHPDPIPIQTTLNREIPSIRIWFFQHETRKCGTVSRRAFPEENMAESCEN